MRETDEWLAQTNSLLESSKNITFEQKNNQFDLLNSEEFDKMIIVAEALINKIANQEEYRDLEGLDRKYAEIKVEFDTNFERKVNSYAKLVNQVRLQLSESVELSNPNSSSNLIF